MIHDVLSKTLIGGKPLHTIFNKVVGLLVRDYNGTKYSILFGPKKYVALFSRIRYLAELKCGITYVDSPSYKRSKLI